MKRVRYLMMTAVVLLVLLLGMNVLAQEQYVYDDAKLLSDAEEMELHGCAMLLGDDYGMKVLAVTTDDAQGKSAGQYADDFYDKCFPDAEDEDGVLFLIDMDNREIYVSTSGTAIRYLTDERIERILDEAYPYAADGDYYEAFLALLKETRSFFEKGIPKGQYIYDTETGEKEFYADQKRITTGEFLFALIAALAAAGITAGVIVGKYQLRFEDFHYDAYTDSEVELSVNSDRLVNTFVTHRHIPRNENSGSSGTGRSSVHTSSAGRSHGGGGRKF